MKDMFIKNLGDKFKLYPNVPSLLGEFVNKQSMFTIELNYIKEKDK